MLLLQILLLATIAHALTLRGSIVPSDLLPSLSVLPSTTAITLKAFGVSRKTYITETGNFTFSNVPEGSYLLQVQCLSRTFPSYRVNVLSKDQATWNSAQDGADGEDVVLDLVMVYKTYPGQVWNDLGARQSYPIEFKATSIPQYYTPRPGLSVLGLMKNPMVLISLVMLAGVFLMPKLVDLNDPDTAEQLKSLSARKEAAGPNPVESLTNFDISGWLAGKK